MGKRLFDCVLVLLSFPLWGPLLVLIGLLVAVLIGRPVFFRQERPGKDGKSFRLIKFRTMTEARGPDGQLLPDTERLTRFGRLLRSSSLDELPELIHILRGEMSLVGPRPLLMHYLAAYTPDEARRMEVAPGLTGWAQVNGRNAVGWEEKFALDVWYVENRSLWLDIKILWLTIWAVVTRKGISAAGEATARDFVEWRKEVREKEAIKLGQREGQSHE